VRSFSKSVKSFNLDLSDFDKERTHWY